MSNATEFVRPEYGTPYQRSRITAVKSGPYTRKVLRDRDGRIVGVEGRTLVDDLAEQVAEVESDTEGLSERVEQLEANPTATDAIAEVSEVVTQAEGRITQRVSEIATGDNLTEGAKALKDSAEALQIAVEQQRESTMRSEGWRPAAAGALWVNARNLGEVGIRLGVSWPVTVSWMTAKQAIAKGKDGYRAASTTREHRIVLRKGYKVSTTARMIRHELAHCAQVERLGNDFDRTYLADGGKALEAEADQLAETLTAFELVRAA